MNEVVFPGLGLKFEFSKVAFRIFGLAVYKYAICIVIGIALSLVLMRVSKAKFGIKYEDVLKCAIWTIIFGTIGARLFYVIFSMNYYIHHLGEIFMLKQQPILDEFKLNLNLNDYKCFNGGTIDNLYTQVIISLIKSKKLPLYNTSSLIYSPFTFLYNSLILSNNSFSLYSELLS